MMSLMHMCITWAVHKYVCCVNMNSHEASTRCGKDKAGGITLKVNLPYQLPYTRNVFASHNNKWVGINEYLVRDH